MRSQSAAQIFFTNDLEWFKSGRKIGVMGLVPFPLFAKKSI
jgi:hypothetical protein